MTPRAAIRAAGARATTTAIRRAALVLLLAAILLAGGTLAGPTPPASADTLTVSSIAITSSPADGDDYHAGETITVQVTFSETVIAYGDPIDAVLAIGIGAGTVDATAPDATGRTTATVDFNYVVKSTDADADGITVATTAMNGSFTHMDTAAHTQTTATLPGTLVAAQSSHKINSTPTIDYDTDDDGLIEVDSLAKLDAIRYNLNGDGNPSGTNAAAHAAAFPTPMDYHGCDADGDGTLAACTGYELTANLDFDTNDNGYTHQSGTGDSGDTYHTHASAMGDAGEGWVPIGGHANSGGTFSGAFEGNNHTISNLYIDLDTSSNDDGRNVGLFGKTSGALRNLGLVNPYVKNTRSGGGTLIYSGALSGTSSGAVSRSYVDGGQVIGGQSAGGINIDVGGCLLGNASGTVSDSYATCDVTATTGNYGQVGGLIGYVEGTVRRSYANGTMTSDYRAGGLLGAAGNSSISDSYATGAVSVSTNDSNAGGLVGWANSAASVTNSYATGNVSADSSSDVGGLVGETAANNVRVIGSYATGNVSATGNSNNLGGLVGYLRQSGAVIGSYATGNVSTTGDSNNMGGLVGRMLTNGSLIRASYATGSVSATGNSNNMGGLAGQINVDTSITASYAIGSVSTTGTGATLGGLVASAVGAATVTNSYWDSTTSTQASSPGGGTAQTTSNLQMPTEYGTSPSIYENWNVDADGQTGSDDPWDFGTNSQYPILKFGHYAVSIALQRNPQHTTTDYDTDNDNLIDITTLSQLNGIRYDLDGDGRNTGDDALGYLKAFPGVSRDMGCPATCIGYELLNDLDFDYDESGSTHTAGVIDSGDTVAATAAYFDSTTGWTPIGGHTSSAAPYTAIFEGNGNTIDNLYINLTTTAATDSVYVGLFADIGKPATTTPAAPAVPGVVRNLGLVDPYVLNTRTGSASPFTRVSTGALAGRNSAAGTVSGSYVSGGSVNGTQNTSAQTVYNFVGCLLGYNRGDVTAAYADNCAATATGTDDAIDTAGGLIGWSEGAGKAVSLAYATGAVAGDQFAGGLIGEAGSGNTVTTSYATGAVTVSGGNGRAGGLIGSAVGAITASYATGAVATTGTGTSSNPNRAGGLVGNLGTGGTITASYATGTVTTSGAGNGRVGGLVGVIGGTTQSPASITASYAIGGVTDSGGGTNILGGLVGGTSGTSSQTNVHWNNESVANGGTGQAASGGSANTAGRTGAQLKEPTDYGASATDAFYNWNVNLDGVTGGDDPWDFGTGSDYPVISYGGISLRAQGRTPVDYDADNDGLIDIDSLARLNAVRYDLDGNGVHSNTAYNAAFVNRDRSAAGLMGCPLADHDDDEMTPQQAHCTGYELTVDLTFDTDASGGIAAGDDYWNSGAGWVPIGDGTNDYSGVFEGNRHTIDYLLISVSGGGATAPLRVGLFGQLDEAGVIRGVGLVNASVSRTTAPNGGIYAGALVGNNYGTVTASSAAGSVSATAPSTAASNSFVGGLVGQNGTGGAINASWANVAVAVNAPLVRAGGLVGDSYGGKITASYAMGAVTVTDSNGANAAGLVGRIQDNTARDPDVLSTIDASYATGAVSGSGAGARTLGGLVASSTATARVTNSYWDTSITSDATASAGGGTGQTTTELQGPTEYGGIYAMWNVDVDGVSGNDDPWHFGTASQYPTLKYGGFSPAAQGSTGKDYDTDSDGLIEITTLAQLDAIRLDLDGDGRPTSVLAYRSAFPVGDVGTDAEMGTAGRMGCAYDHNSDPNDALLAECRGYELMENLDFDTDEDGATHTAGVGDSGDEYYNGGAGWNPIGGHDADAQPYTAILDGNDNDIENLFINLDTSADNDGRFAGLFANISSSGAVRNLGLVNPYVKNARSGGGRFIYYGALAGNSDGAVSRVSVRGGQVAGGQTNAISNNNNYVGCLLGRSQGGTVSDSYATCAATVAGGGRGVVGGLVGYNRGGTVLRSYAEGAVSSDYQAGGLVGFSGRSTGRISDSYATGAVSSSGHGEAGGLVGFNNAGADIVDSYATGAVSSSGSGSGATNTADAGGLVGEMTSPGSTLTGSYAAGAVSTTGNYNAVGGLVGFVENGATVAGSYATGTVRVTAAASSNNSLGGLVGRLTGNTSTGLSASYATGAVSGNGGGTNNLGGLVGLINRNNPHIRAAYATGAVSASGSGTNRLGGLVGYADTSASNYPRIAASYAAGAVSASGSGSNTLGGLVGGVATIGRPVFTNVYWDSEATGQATSADLAGDAAQTTDALRNPIGYTGIYSAWNIDVDQTGNANDDPWDFGTDSEYPVLIYGALTATGQGRTLFDYDDDNDGLIDITTLAQLDAMRYDLNGDGDIAAANAPDYRAAYPNRDGSAAGRMGCPAGACTGYELFNDLDFDTDGDGSTHTGGASDSGDAYHNGGNGWSRIGDSGTPYSATFDGKGHTIDNLFMRIPDGERYGLFGQLSGGGVITSLGVRNAYVANASGAEPDMLGILVGLINDGDIVASYTTGYVRGYGEIGGLAGRLNHANAAIKSSYSTATVAADTGFGAAGGLVGLALHGAIEQSYYAGGSVTGKSSSPNKIGGLIGELSGGGTAAASSDSYWDKTPGGVPNTSATSPAAAGKTTAELQAPAGYAGSIYAGWNVDLDNADGDDNLATGGDDPWDFRLGHYPVLKYGGHDVDEQRPIQAEAGAGAEAYSGQTVTLDGSGRSLSGAALTYMWTQVDDGDEGDPTVALARNDTASLTFTAPTGLTRDATLVFRLTVSAGGRSVYDEVTVSIVAVRPNQLLSLSLTDSEGDAVGLAPPFVSLRYDYAASVANQISSVTITPGVLEGSTMTLNGQTATSGAAVEIPLKYRGNQITIVVTPPEPDETMNGETADGETADDETVEETPCSVDNDGVKPCTYTVTVNRAVPPRLAFVPRSLTIDEGGTGTYTVELDTRILTGAVTIAIAIDHPDVTVSPTTVTLRPLDMAPRTITVTAASDADRNDETATLTHTANGAHYYDVIATVGVTVNDTTAPPPAPDPALSVSATALRLAEGGSGSYTVALATRPDNNVTVTIASDNADVTTRPTALTFTTANWNTAQRVTASAASDGDTANDTATLTHTASGGGYGEAPAVQVAVSVIDNDTAGLAITPTVLNLIENGISAYIVSLTAQPSGNVTVAIASDNPDVTVRPTALTFTPTNWATPQAVLVITRADAGGGDELATLRMTAQGGGYAGQTGQVLASVDDRLAPLPAGSVTTSPDAPAGVSVYGPPGSAATATVAAAADTPTVATGAGFGIGSAVAVSVSGAPDDGLEICLPVSDALRAEAGSALILTLLRYAGGSWTELSGARDLGDRVCAAGVTGQAAYATAYALRPGTVLDLAASAPADAPGTIALSWTPPAAGTSQVAVVVNIADDTDYCLDTLPGLDASSYTCAGRTAGATYVALLIVLLPDGGYTLANIVRFDLPAASS